jgi:cytochrome c oxidase accessory protein FixG
VTTAPSTLTAVRPDGKHTAIHPLDVRGRFITARRIVFAILIGVYVAAPLVHIGGHPAIHLDVASRKFYLLGTSFNAQDVWILLFLLTGALFTLLLVTAWRGRVWCGWACPQTVFLEAIYRPIERFFEGPRSRRIKLPQLPWTASRVLRTAGKHLSYFIVSALLAHVALALFLPFSQLAAMMGEGPAAHPVPFTWAAGVTCALYFNFTWFREQLCVVLCPYGRLQSLLHDPHSIVIGYDHQRGEPRGPLRKETAPGDYPRGDCIDCKKCVHVCPTAIDIRVGFQMECLACAQCIDVCDEVMDKIGKPRGLIRYASLEQFRGRPTRQWRPRLYLYIVLVVVALGGLSFGLGGRVLFESNVYRPPGVPWVIEGNEIRNQVQLHLVNKSTSPRTYSIRVEAPMGMTARFESESLQLESLQDTYLPLILTSKRDDLPHDPTVKVYIRDTLTGQERVREVGFMAPGRKRR